MSQPSFNPDAYLRKKGLLDTAAEKPFDLDAYLAKVQPAAVPPEAQLLQLLTAQKDEVGALSFVTPEGIPVAEFAPSPEGKQARVFQLPGIDVTAEKTTGKLSPEEQAQVSAAQLAQHGRFSPPSISAPTKVDLQGQVDPSRDLAMLPVNVAKNVARPIIEGGKKFISGLEEYAKLGQPRYYEFPPVGQKGELKPVYTQQPLTDIPRSISDMLLGATETGIGVIPGMMAVNAAVPIIQPAAEEAVGKLVGNITAALSPYDEKIARNIGEEKGRKAVELGLGFGVGAIFGKPVLAGMVLSEVAGAVTEAILKDKSIEPQDKERILGLAKNLAFFTGAIGAGMVMAKTPLEAAKQSTAHAKAASQVLKGAKPEDVAKIQEIVDRFEEVRPSGEQGPPKILEAGKPPETPGLVKSQRDPRAQILAERIKNLRDNNPTLRESEAEAIALQMPLPEQSLIIKPEGEVTRTGEAQREIQELPPKRVTPLEKPIPAIDEQPATPPETVPQPIQVGKTPVEVTPPKTSAEFTQRALE